MKKTIPTLFAAVALSFLGACDNSRPDTVGRVDEAIKTAAAQMRINAAQFEADSIFPRSFKDGEYRLVSPRDWTSGFFPGSLWYMYELSGDEYFREQALAWTAKLSEIPYYKGTHDLGFMVFCSWGNQQRIEGDEISAKAVVDASESLISRFDPRVGLIRSWDFGEWNYPVIIDNMMNLEMLFWASTHTGNPQYRDIAITHADNTIKNHFRDDYSAYHVVSYNDDGTVESKGTHQGFSDSSAWARGEAWAFYGYVMCYRETGLERYLTQALNIAGFFMNHPNVPSDLIPYWDYNAPDIPDASRDASAAAVYASALLELSTMNVPDAGKYFDYAEKILESLSSPGHLAAVGSNGGFVLMHCVGHLPAGSEVDVPLNYADYYYLEAMGHYLDIKKAAGSEN